MIELGHCIALSSFDALRKRKRVFLLCTLLSGAEERERERDVVAPTLPTCPYMYVVPLTAGNRFLYGDARSC